MGGQTREEANKVHISKMMGVGLGQHQMRKGGEFERVEETIKSMQSAERVNAQI